VGDVDEFKLYGLGEKGEYSSLEIIRAESTRAAVEIAITRLNRFYRVELWQGGVCVLRKSRDDPR
jgi:hypothetical protein